MDSPHRMGPLHRMTHHRLNRPVRVACPPLRTVKLPTISKPSPQGTMTPASFVPSLFLSPRPSALLSHFCTEGGSMLPGSLSYTCAHVVLDCVARPPCAVPDLGPARSLARSSRRMTHYCLTHPSDPPVWSARSRPRRPDGTPQDHLHPEAVRVQPHDRRRVFMTRA